MKHKHHIIPRHAGGTDDPSNLIELTIEEHAEAHRLLYEQYGEEKDRIAWLGLSGQIDKEEILEQLYIENGKRQGKRNVESGHWAKLHSIGGKVGGSISGKKHVKSGHWNNCCKLGGKSAISKRIDKDPNYQRNCFQKMLEKYPDNQSKAGKLGAKRAVRKVISEEDGYVTSRNNIRYHERKTGFTHTWKDYDQENAQAN